MLRISLISGIFSLLFFSCNTNTENTDINTWKNKGDSIITKSFDTLKNSLSRTIGQKGFKEAINYCNTAAVFLTNTYATEKVTIRRSSEKYRNKENAPDSLEQTIFSILKNLQEKKQSLSPQYIDQKNQFHYFKPIMMQAMCLNCHGNKTVQIKPEVWQTIQDKYPSDLAFDYKEGELRGIWHITFSKRND